MTNDLQDQVDSKERCQEKLNQIYQNCQILLGDTKKYTKEYLAQLASDNEKAWEEVVKIATSMTN